MSIALITGLSKPPVSHHLQINLFLLVIKLQLKRFKLIAFVQNKLLYITSSSFKFHNRKSNILVIIGKGQRQKQGGYL